MSGSVVSRLHVALGIWIAICLVVSCKKTEISYGDYLEMKNYLEYINMPAVTTVETEDGDIFNCVDINKQPALDHPALRNHVIQMEPASVPNGMNVKPESNIAMKTGLPDGGCPIGTVPIRRVRMKELLRAGSVSNLMNKYGQPSNGSNQLKASTHLYAITSLTTQAGSIYKGALVSINVWNPPVKYVEILSLASIRIANGAVENLNTIEVGWQVYPGLYGDYETHLFIYWTADAYRTTGCYNLMCAGFVQISTTITPGMKLPKISQFNGTQEDIALLVFYEFSSKNWWLVYHESQSSTIEIVGYWPSSLFNTLVESSNRIDWGGETVGHAGSTFPPMGSGLFPDEGFERTAYMKQVMYMDSSWTPKDVPNNLPVLQSQPNCYKFKDMGTGLGGLGRYFFVGGPGGFCS